MATQPKHHTAQARYAMLFGKITLYAGTLILLASLVYMVVNLNRADSIVYTWFVFMLTGAFLIVLSMAFSRWYRQKRQ